MTTNDIAQDDARSNLQAAYAYYKGETLNDTREPLYPALLAGTFRLIKADTLERCFRGEKLPACPRINTTTKSLNWLFHALSTILAGIAVLSITQRRPLALLAMAGISLNTVMISAVNNWLPEPQAMFFLLAHSIMLYGIVAGESRKACAVLSGLSLGLLILTKYVFIYLLYIYLALGLFLLFKRKPELLLLCLIAAALVIPFNDKTPSKDPLDYNRGAAVMAIRAEYDTMPWNEIPAAFLYFTPEIGPKLTKKYYGENIAAHFERDNKDGYYGRVKRQTGQAYALAKKEKITLQQAALRIIQNNILKHIVLTPVFAYEGLFIPKKIAADNIGNPAVKAFSKVVNILLLPLCLVAAIWLLYRKYYVFLLFAAPSIYSFAIHSVLTHYWPRYSVPLLAIGLVFACIAWHLKREEKREEKHV